MSITKLVFKEMSRQLNQLFTSLLAITLGIAVVVGIKNITVFSEKAVSGEIDALGANILILPKSASVQDYYSADFQNEEIPESYVSVLTNSDLQGIDNLSPKLSLPLTVKGHKAILTGILPKNEFKSKAIWQSSLGIFSRPEGCGVPVTIPGVSDSPKTLVRKRVIDDLSENSMLVGFDIASQLNLREGDSLALLGKTFTIEAILPPTGTVDDSRLFAHLHTVQKLNHKDSLLNVIEIVGCCSSISSGLIQKINKLLPDAKVVTITQIVQTQLNTTTLMKKISLILLWIIILVGGASIANYMFANVYERRREIGILMALGAKPLMILRIFLLKSFIIGFVGGIIGFLLGSLIAVLLGPRIAGIPVAPLPSLAFYGTLLSILISLMASIIPSFRATKVDPSIIMQED